MPTNRIKNKRKKLIKDFQKCNAGEFLSVLTIGK